MNRARQKGRQRERDRDRQSETDTKTDMRGQGEGERGEGGKKANKKRQPSQKETDVTEKCNWPLHHIVHGQVRLVAHDVVDHQKASLRSEINSVQYIYLSIYLSIFTAAYTHIESIHNHTHVHSQLPHITLKIHAHGMRHGVESFHDHTHVHSQLPHIA